ncbi:MAG TPA: PD-(D/E)XK nuclease family protein [Phycisphaerae bacterium]|nr:PD-(D/E)XK nuclease family protein [Phycisphaerae bacterium]
MSVRFITGRAGAGKTHFCQSEVCRELVRSLIDGPRLIMLVPEQAALQMERGLLGMLQPHNILALGRCEVLSFRRLANRIFSESTGRTPTPLSSLGRQMALRLLISRHRKSLREFAKVADRGSFVAEISRGIAQLMQEAISVEQLEEAARAAEDAADPTAARLHDAALLYRAYLEYLGDTRVDPEGVLDLARSRLSAATWLHGSRVFADGFAGFTQQQLRMMVSLAQIASHLDLALLLDPKHSRADQRSRAREEAVGAPRDKTISFTGDLTLGKSGLDPSLFARTGQTHATLLRTLIDSGIALDSPIELTPATPPRFEHAPSLAALERELFHVPPIVKVEERFASTGPDAAADPLPLHAELQILRCRDRRAEVAAAARTVLDLVQREQNPLRFRDIAIIVRDLAPYHDIISAELRAHGIPFFIDRRRPTHHHPLVQLVRALVSLNGGAAVDEAIVRMMKSGLSGLRDAQSDAVENYARAFNLSDSATWTRQWTRPLPGTRGANPRTQKNTESNSLPPPGPPAAVRFVDAARAMLIESLRDVWPVSKSGGAGTQCAEWVRRLYAALRKMRVPSTLAAWQTTAIARNDLDEAAEHEHVWSEIINLLDELHASLGEEAMTGRQFREVIESALSEFSLGLTPSTLDQVLVSSIERSRHPPVKAAFVLGLCEGGFPARVRENTIFGDAERAYLSSRNATLGRSRDEQQLDERALAYIAVTRPSRQLYLSYPESDASGRPLEPSSYLNAILGALPEARVEPDSEDFRDTRISTPIELASCLNRDLSNWARGRAGGADVAPALALYDWARTKAPATLRNSIARSLRALAPIENAMLRDAVHKDLWPAPHRTSITQLETMAQCSFRHFARYGLNLTERVEQQVSHVHLGNLYHEVLEQFVNDLLASQLELRDMSDADVYARLSAICEQTLPLYAERLGLSDAQRDRVAWRARLELPFAVHAQRATVGKTLLRPRFTERLFGDERDPLLPALELTLKSGESVLVRGKIDRIDFVREGATRLAVVFDYKRSLGRRLSLDAAFHGLQLQLLAYLLVLRDAGIPTDRADIVPGGAFFLPLLSRHTRVDHPNEAHGQSFDPFTALRPRGVVDFDWIEQLEPAFKLAETKAPIRGRASQNRSAKSAAFTMARRKDGQISNLNISDAVPKGVMALLLDHVRAKLTDLAELWLQGDIKVMPARHGTRMACVNCEYRSVCAFEFVSHRVNTLTPMSRGDVIEKLTGKPAEPKKEKPDEPFFIEE